jgi:RNA polymerase sigma-70 factor (ECF subfamily)
MAIQISVFHRKDDGMKRWLGFPPPVVFGFAFASLPFSGMSADEGKTDSPATTNGADFATLVPPHTPAMLRVAAALVGSADAEDATQEAIMRAWQSWASLRDPHAARPWLLSITVNVCRQWRRGGFGRRQRLNQPLSDQIVEQITTFADDPGASDHAAALDLRHAINSLPDDLRAIVVLRYYGGMDATEIGTALSLASATVRTRLRRAMSMLRERLQGIDAQCDAATQEGDAHA